MVEVLFFVVIFFGVFLQSSVGFGTVVTMPLGILLMGMGVTKPVVTFIALLTGLSVLIKEHKHINRRELAKMVGVTAAAICRYENGTRSPKTEIAKRIAKVLNIAWYELIDNADG